MHFSIDRTVHTTAFDKPVVDHWLEWKIAQTAAGSTEKDRSDDLPLQRRARYRLSYIPLPVKIAYCIPEDGLISVIRNITTYPLIMPCISYSPKCYYGLLWDIIWLYTPNKYSSGYKDEIFLFHIQMNNQNYVSKYISTTWLY